MHAFQEAAGGGLGGELGGGLGPPSIVEKVMIQTGVQFHLCSKSTSCV